MKDSRKDNSSGTSPIIANSEDSKSEIPQFRGLYKNVKISVRTLDIIIVVCLVVIAVFLIIDLQNPGFTITFDSKGGSDVAPQNQMYGELLDVPAPPTREGYSFTGWFTDYACFEIWDVENDIIQTDITLYAGWE